MQATATTLTGTAPVANVLGIVAALIVAASMAHIRLPLLGSDRATFIGLVVVAMTMCALGGIGRAQSTVGWSDPITIVGIVIGALALGLVGVVLAGQAEFLAPVARLVRPSLVEPGLRVVREVHLHPVAHINSWRTEG